MSLFKPDSPIMRAMSRATDLIILNILFLVSCLPIVTIGPAVTALYTVSFSIGTTRENGVLIPYLRAFRSNFGIALKIWLILLLVGAALLADLFLSANFEGFLGATYVIFGALGLLELMISSIIFALTSLFQSSIWESLKNSLILAIANLPRAVAVLLMWLLPVILLFRYPLVFFGAGLIWFSIYFGAAGYLSSLLLRKVFEPFLPDEMFEQEAAD